MLHKSIKTEAYADIDCRDCVQRRNVFGHCAKCPFNLEADFELVRATEGLTVTPEIYKFANHIAGLVEDLELYGRPDPDRELEPVERMGIKLYRQESALLTKHQTESARRGK